ncbi:hypothetical protein BKA83DRAFT_4494776 [Pisolithus microcarpus]|nr:hypothetical protein BKA83DRAFT_4494776 [Pisolithus microcarpus]
MPDSTFRWEDAEMFASLANLLSLRKEACFGPTERGDEDTEDDMDSAHARAGGDLKRRFLDSFAKVMSRSRGGKCVACVALRESGDVDLEEPDGVKVTLLIARNGAFEDVDYIFCNEIERLLAALGASARKHTKAFEELTETLADPVAEKALWEAMLHYNEPRLKQYAAALKRSVLAFADCGYLDRIPPYHLAQPASNRLGVGAFCDSDAIGSYCWATHAAYMQFAQAHIRQFLSILSSGNKGEQSRLLAEKAYSIRRMKSVWMFIKASCDDSDLILKLLSDIQFMGRLRSGYHTLIAAAETIPGFVNLSIKLVNKPPHHRFLQILPPLDSLFRCLGLPLNSTTVREYVGDTTIAAARKDFKKLQEKSMIRTRYHAEIQLVFYIAQGTHPKTMTKEFYPYIGCSKLCCFLCFTFLRFFGQRSPFFKVRGCHGRVFPRWSLPETNGLHLNMCMELLLALRETSHYMSCEVTRAVATCLPTMAESSAGMTDDYSAPSPYIHDYHMKLAVESKFHALRTAMAANWSNKAHEATANSETEDKIEFTQYSRSPLSSGKCSHCGRKTSRKCSKCTGPWLCNKACEDAYDFYDHNFRCAVRRPLDSADYLERACWKSEIPDDIDTLEKFGFTKFPSAFDQRNLLDVFIGLTQMGIGNRELRQWQEDGTLVPNIMSAYEGKPKYSRRAYYKSFREKLYILNRIDTEAYTPDVLAIARHHLDAGDQFKDLHELVPDAKQKSFLLYAILVNGWHPDPSHPERSSQDLYYTFGFCLCCDVHAERELAGLYRTLISKCSFQEFWLAYQSHRLVSLMDAKGLGKARQNIRHLKSFLKTRPNDWCPTVWHLRLFTQSQATLPGRHVVIDYGFLNCETVEEQLALKEIYKRLLEIPRVDPMELHAACINGQLYSFTRKYLPDLQRRFRKLMKNLYPTDRNAEGAGKWRWASPVHCQSGW